MTMQLDYEHFVLRAFGYPGRMLDRGKDPAGMGDTDFFLESNIASVKAAVAYGMTIFFNAIVNHVGELDDDECDRIEDFQDHVIGAKGLVELHGLIEEFESTVIGKYFVGKDGKLHLN